jgi:predicted NUDIX family phosphoesterase
MMADKVLVVRNAALETLHFERGFTFDTARALPLVFRADAAFFSERDKAEVSKQFRQIIPYVVLCAGSRVCTYVRGSVNEPRLKGRRSIGFGGHVILSDRDHTKTPFNWYLQGLRRELREEIGVAVPSREHTLAIISDETSAVGSVHIGILHLWEVSEAEIKAREADILDLAFMALPQLRRRRDYLESWSKISLDILEASVRKTAAGMKLVENPSLFESASTFQEQILAGKP